MNEKIKTGLTAPRKLWCKLKIIAGDKGITTNSLVIETLQEKYGNVEVKV